jgi:hypothetical protein
MKKTIFFILTLVISMAIITYLCGIFILLEWDVSKWLSRERGIALFIWIIFSIILYCELKLSRA